LSLFFFAKERGLSNPVPTAPALLFVLPFAQSEQRSSARRSLSECHPRHSFISLSARSVFFLTNNQQETALPLAHLKNLHYLCSSFLL